VSHQDWHNWGLESEALGKSCDDSGVTLLGETTPGPGQYNTSRASDNMRRPQSDCGSRGPELSTQRSSPAWGFGARRKDSGSRDLSKIGPGGYQINDEWSWHDGSRSPSPTRWSAPAWSFGCVNRASSRKKRQGSPVSHQDWHNWGLESEALGKSWDGAARTPFSEISMSKFGIGVRPRSSSPACVFGPPSRTAPTSRTRRCRSSVPGLGAYVFGPPWWDDCDGVSGSASPTFMMLGPRTTVRTERQHTKTPAWGFGSALARPVARKCCHSKQCQGRASGKRSRKSLH